MLCLYKAKGMDRKMLLVVDVGNTNITFGIFQGERLEATFRMTTKLQRTSDEYGICIRDLVSHNKLNPEDVRDVIIASVVPNVMHSLLSSFIKYFDIKPVIVEPGIKTGIRIATENPRQLGADRIVDAAAAYGQYGGPVFVIDFGTGTTYDLVDETGKVLDIDVIYPHEKSKGSKADPALVQKARAKVIDKINKYQVEIV